MSQDERSLFGDEQAYITWKRQQEAEARAEALKAAQARKKRRRVKYSDRIRRAFRNIAKHNRMTAIRADPERYDEYKRNNRLYEAQRRADVQRHARRCETRRQRYARQRDMMRLLARVYRSTHVEQARARSRQWYLDHREEQLQKMRDYRSSHHDEICANQRIYNKTHREERRAYNQAYSEAHREEKRAYNKAYKIAHREELLVRERARYAAKKAARQNQSPDAS